MTQAQARAQHIAIHEHRTATIPQRASGRSRATPTAVARSGVAALGLALVEALIGYEWLLSALSKMLSPTFRSGLAQQVTMAMRGNPNAWWVALMRRLAKAGHRGGRSTADCGWNGCGSNFYPPSEGGILDRSGGGFMHRPDGDDERHCNTAPY